MAKAKGLSDEIMWDALRKGLAGKLPLFSVKETKTKKGVDGMFAAGATSQPYIDKAQADGWIEVVENETIEKKKMVIVRVVYLTPAGRAYIIGIDSPKKQLETLAAAIESLVGKLAALDTEPKPTEKPDITTFMQNVQADFTKFLFEMKASFDEQIKPVSDDGKADLHSVATMLLSEAKTALGNLGDPLPLPPVVVPPVVVPPVIQPVVPPVVKPAVTDPVPPVNYEKVMKEAYSELCLYVEFTNKIVELPRLYHEMKKSLHSLTPQEFHAELQRLWQARKLELMIINEEYLAKEPTLGIRENDALYYYIIWK